MKSNNIIVGRVNNHAMERSDMFSSFLLIVFSILPFIVFFLGKTISPKMQARLQPHEC